MLELESCTIDLDTGAVHGGPGVPLTDLECSLLRYLASRPSEPVTRDALLLDVWGYSDQVVSRAVDSAIRRLREKIEVDPSKPRHLITVFGHGYRFEALRKVEAVLPVARTPARRSLVLGDRVCDLERGVVRGPLGEVPLTTIEIELLACLGAQDGRILDRREILREVWGQHGDGKGLVDSAIHRLRTKIEPDPNTQRYLLTVRGSGYRLNPTPRSNTRPEVTLVHVGVWQERLLWEQHPTDAGEWLATTRSQVDPLARDAGGAADGGGWRYLFPDPTAALRFGAAVVARADTPVQLRVAVHRGRPIVWVDPVTGVTSCIGPDVHRVDDLLVRATAGAVLVDGDLWSEIGPSSGLTATPAGLGAVRVGDGGPDVPIGRATSRTLPWRPDRFVGRATELAAIGGALADGQRLVTLVGPAGVGKSRLGLEVCSPLRRAGGVWFVSLGGATSESAVVAAISGALGLAFGDGPASEATERLTLILTNHGPTVLWLDDAEQAGPALSRLAERWHAEASDLALVVTSRIALGVRSERVFSLEPLPREDAVALFVARAGSAFDTESVDALVAELDGLPLAIELAAARSSSLSPTQLLARLPDRLRLLATPGGSTDRHGSLRAALDVSWGLLDRWEQAALARCAVFRGGFTLEAAEVVLDRPEPGVPWVLDVVEALVRHHLIRVDHDRYVLLDAVRAFADEHLTAEERTAAERAHGALYARLGSRPALAALHGTGGLDRFARLARELGNLEVAADRTTDDEIAAGAVLALVEIGVHRGAFVDQLIRLGPLIDRGAPRQAELLLARGRLRSVSGDRAAAMDDLRAAIAAAAQAGDLLTEGTAHVRLAETVGQSASDEIVAPHHERALELAEACGDLRLACLATLGIAGRAPVDERSRHIEAALRLARQGGDVELEGIALGHLGLVAYLQKRMESARDLYEAALICHRRAGDLRAEAHTLGNLGNAVRATDTRASAACYQDAIVAHRRFGSRRGEALCQMNLGALAFDAGDYEETRQRIESALVSFVAVGAERNEALARFNLCMALYRLGRRDEALEQLERSIGLADHTGWEGFAADALRRMAAEDPDDERALGWLDRALAYHPSDRRLLGRILASRSEVLAQTDRVAAEQALAEAERQLDGLALDEEITKELASARAALRVHRLRGARSPGS